jgi:DNA/RNA-binding domain of Phe-tRNA-synthetase-like protein
MQFQLTESASALGLRLVVWCEYGLNNRDVAPELGSLRENIYAQARSADPQRDAVIAGFDMLRKRIGRSIRRFPPSPLALQGQFERRGELGAISPAVDIYNLVSLATGLSIGGHDLSAIQGDIRLDITQGHETFLPLGSDDERLVPAQEYAYLDASDRVLCRMEYRQSGHTCIGVESRDCVFIVQGHAATSMATLEQAADRVSSLLAGYCGSRRGETWRLG